MTEGNKLIAKVNNEEITEADFNRLLTLMGEQGTQFRTEKEKDRLRDELVHQKLLYFSAVDKGIEDDDDFKKAFEQTKRQFIQQYALTKMLNDVTVEEEDIKEYYEAHKDRLVAVHQFDADHILVDSLEEADDIKEQLDQGADFAELAQQKSSCPSKERGGNLGAFQSGQMVPEFENALLDMEEGEISEPVKSQFGYHVIKLNEKNKIQDTDYESVKPQLSQQFLMLKQQEKYANEMRNLEKVYPVERYYGEEE